jgi:short-subunit dehydrogenase
MAKHLWKGKTVAVCGASAGLGSEFARELARQQVRGLALIARSREPLNRLREQLLHEHPSLNVIAITADLCERDEVHAAAEKLTLEFEKIDLLVQAVGRSDRGRIAELTQSHLQDLFDVNVVSSLNAVQCFQPVLSPPGGTLVLIGSLASKFAPRFMGGYAIVKHALAALAQQSRLELAERGIHVLFACPGPIARDDAGQRYERLTADKDLPATVLQPGGGARVRGLDARKLVVDILQAAADKKPEIVRPRKARLLHLISAFSPTLGDRLLRKNSS